MICGLGQCPPGLPIRRRQGRVQLGVFQGLLRVRGRSVPAHGQQVQFRELTVGRSTVHRTLSVRQNTSGAKTLIWRTTSGVRRRRQQADFAGHDGGRQTHAETVTIAAHIEQMTPCGKQGGKLPDLGQELAQRDGAIGAPGDDAVRGDV